MRVQKRKWVSTLTCGREEGGVGERWGRVENVLGGGAIQAMLEGWSRGL